MLAWSWPSYLSLVCCLRGLPGDLKVLPFVRLYYHHLLFVIHPENLCLQIVKKADTARRGAQVILECVVTLSILRIHLCWNADHVEYWNDAADHNSVLNGLTPPWFCWTDGPWHWRLRISVKHQLFEGGTASGDRRKPTPAIWGEQWACPCTMMTRQKKTIWMGTF